MSDLNKMVRKNRQGIRQAALSLLEKHNGGIGSGAPDEPFGPCECLNCERARKWLRLATATERTHDS